MWKNINFATKLNAGFGVVIVLLAALATASVTGIWKVERYFTDYRETARTSVALGKFKDLLMEARLSALKHRANDSEENKKSVEQRIQQMVSENETFAGVTSNQVLKSRVNGYKKELKNYENAFKNTVILQAHRHDHVDVLSKTGPVTRQKISDIIESAYRDGDVEAAYRGGLVNESLMLGRFYAERFLLKNTEKSYKRAIAELTETKTRLDRLLAALENPTRRALANSAKEKVGVFMAALKETQGTISERNQFRSEMDVIGPKLMASYENVLKEQIDVQNTLGPEAQASIGETSSLVMLLSVICAVSGFALAFFLGRTLSAGINGVTEEMSELANGNKNVEITGTDRGDEIGKMARALDIFKKNALEVERLEREQKDAEKVAADKRRDAMNNLADEFEKNVGAIVQDVLSAVDELKSSAGSMSSIAETTNQEVVSVSSAADEATANVNTVAAATEQLSASIHEVSQQISSASNLSVSTAEEAQRTSNMVQELSSVVSEIVAITDLIQDIAHQTNLLALNATIEAARAGDAGKGFAVVASEVKELAEQTSKATEDIKQQIDSIQTASNTSVEAVDRITTMVQEISASSQAVAAAAEQQGHATNEISRNVSEAAKGTQQVSESINTVNDAAKQTGSTSSEVAKAADKLFEQAHGLGERMGQFVKTVRAA